MRNHQSAAVVRFAIFSHMQVVCMWERVRHARTPLRWRNFYTNTFIEATVTQSAHTLGNGMQPLLKKQLIWWLVDENWFSELSAESHLGSLPCERRLLCMSFGVVVLMSMHFHPPAPPKQKKKYHWVLRFLSSFIFFFLDLLTIYWTSRVKRWSQHYHNYAICKQMTKA